MNAAMFSEHEQAALDALADRLRAVAVADPTDRAAEFVLWLRAHGWRPTAARPAPRWQPGSTRPAPPTVAQERAAEIRRLLGIPTGEDTTTS